MRVGEEWGWDEGMRMEELEDGDWIDEGRA